MQAVAMTGFASQVASKQRQATVCDKVLARSKLLRLNPKSPDKDKETGVIITLADNVREHGISGQLCCGSTCMHLALSSASAV